MSSVTMPAATATTPPSRALWLDANHRYLCAAIDVVRAALQAHGLRVAGSPDAPAGEPVASVHRALEDVREAMPAPSALDGIAATFHLSDFERQLLVLCAAMEFD